MSKLIRLVNQGVEDILFVKTKDVGQGYNEFHYYPLDMFRNGKFNVLFCQSL